MVAYSTKCLIVKSAGEWRNASPPEKWAILLISGSFTTTCSLYGSLWMGDHFNKAVLMFLSSFWLDDQRFPLALISFKFSRSHLVHWSATERPLCLQLTEDMQPCESPHQLCYSFCLTQTHSHPFLFLHSSFKFSHLILLPFSLLLFLSATFFLPLSHTNTYPVLFSTPDRTFLFSLFNTHVWYTSQIRGKWNPNAVTKVPSLTSSLSVESRLNLGMGHGKDLLFPNNLKRAGAMTVDVTSNRHWHVCSQLKNSVFCLRNSSVSSSLLCQRLADCLCCAVSCSVQSFIDWQGGRPSHCVVQVGQTNETQELLSKLNFRVTATPI